MQDILERETRHNDGVHEYRNVAATAVDEAAAFELRYDLGTPRRLRRLSTAIRPCVPAADRAPGFMGRTACRLQLISIRRVMPGGLRVLSESAHYDADVEAGLLDPEHVWAWRAKRLKRSDAILHGRPGGRRPRAGSLKRFWDGTRRSELGMEVCCHAGMLKRAGGALKSRLSAYNHNLDTSPEFYGSIITNACMKTVENVAAVRERG